jgi:aspartokinase-like uncharacterized kinase
MHPEMIVKVGGSLHDLPDLGRRLRAWLDQQPPRLVLIPGGGPAADWIRDLDACHHLSDERSHWLALRALTLAAHVLAARLPDSIVIEEIADSERAWKAGQIPILDPYAFARADERQPDHLEHSWAVTSDSLAARIAMVAGAAQLVLLKSCSVSEPADWVAAARQGFVDAALPSVLAKASFPLHVTAINFRSWQAVASSAIIPPRIGP